MGKREVLGRRKEVSGDSVVCERKRAASHQITSFHLPHPHSSAHEPYTLLPWVNHLESNRKNAVAQSVWFRGSEVGNWPTNHDSILRKVAYVHGRDLLSLEQVSLHTGQDFSSKLPPWRCTESLTGSLSSHKQNSLCQSQRIHFPTPSYF